VAWQNGYKILTPRHAQTNLQKVNELITDTPSKSWNSNVIDQWFIPSEGALIKQTPLILEPVDD
jgi:hypothetical protein